MTYIGYRIRFWISLLPHGTLAVADLLADNLLAKHDENYVPRELQEMTEHQAAKMAEETTVGLE